MKPACQNYSSTLALLVCAFVAIGCSAPAPRDPTASTDPFALVIKADALASRGEYDEALRDYLSALDHGREVDRAFVAARNDLVGKILALGLKYPPARAALVERLASQAQRIEREERVDGMDLALFVSLGVKIGDEARVRSTYVNVKARLPAEARMRLDLWAAIERHLVEQRRYHDAAAEADGLAAVKYYLALFNNSRADERMRKAIEVTIENEGAIHFEALLGAGQIPPADALAEELIQFSSTGRTFAALIRHARRAGAIDVATRLRTKAHEILSDTERKIVDDATNEPLKEPG